MQQDIPRILRDIKCHQTCTADVLLKAFLNKIRKERPSPNTGEDLEKCLTAVLPLCTDAMVKDLLHEYIRAGIEEQDCYPSFIQMANRALTLTKAAQDSAPIQGIFRDPDPLDISFCRDAGRGVTVEYNDDATPGIIIASIATQRRLACDISIHRGSRAENAPDEDPARFEWGDVLSAIELRWSSVSEPAYLEEYGTTKLQREVRTIQRVTRTFKKAEPKPMVGGIVDLEDAEPLLPDFGPPFSPRPSEESDEEDSEVPVLLGERAPPLIQCAIYGAEMLGRSAVVSHAINLVVLDHVAYIWWYDREGAIQSYGIDIVQDLPRFLVLLFALQRFTLEDWGFVPELDTGLSDGPLSAESPAGQRDVNTVAAPNRVLHLSCGLVGRGTRVVGVAGDGGSLNKDRLAVKFSWIKDTHPSEEDLVRRVLERAGHDPRVSDHLPSILHSRTHSEYSTATIRKVLDLGVRRGPWYMGTDGQICRPDKFDECHRVLRTTVSERLYPIDTLDGAAFTRAFFEIARCHYLAWRVGIRHPDPSFSNLMVRRDEKTGKTRGVLDDWILVRNTSETRCGHAERTGAVPFVALELLSGLPSSLLQHDVESLVWILAWVVGGFNEGVELEDRHPLKDWRGGSRMWCFTKKLAYLRVSYALPGLATASWRALQPVVDTLLIHVWKKFTERDMAAIKAWERTADPNDRTVSEAENVSDEWRSIREVLVRAMEEMEEMEDSGQLQEAIQAFDSRQ